VYVQLRSLVFSIFLIAAPRLSATIIEYGANLSGSNENPPNASLGTGTALVTFDTGANLMIVAVSFTALSSNDTAAHIHCCAAPPGNAGVATQVPYFTGFPISVTSGSYVHTFNMLDAATWNPSFVTANGGTAAGAEAALLTGLAAGQAYLNIHTVNNPGGEIRGFLAPVPEPATWGLTGLAVAGILFFGRKRRILA
jgi:CHRD domain/PEP-CTERM motif